MSVTPLATGADRTTREQLLVAATQLFRSRGYEGTSIEAIGAAAGVRGPALYYHFGSKAALLYETLAAPMQTLLARGREAVAGKKPLDAIRDFTRAHVLFQLTYFDWPQAHRGAIVATGALIQALPAKEQTRLFRLERRHLDSLRDAVSAGVASGDCLPLPVTPTAFAVIGMADQVIAWYVPGEAMSATDLADLYGELAVRMVAAPGRGRRR